MLINGKNYLFLRRMGCEYRKNDSITAFSDVGNHRVRVQFVDKYGVEVLGDLSHSYKWDTSKKKPVMTSFVSLLADLQYEDEKGTWRYYPAVRSDNYTYNVSDILAFINSISAEHYDAVKWVETIEVSQEAGKNFTPAANICEYARANRLETVNTLDYTALRMYTGVYKYLCYSIKPTGDGKEIVTLTLEAV